MYPSVIKNKKENIFYFEGIDYVYKIPYVFLLIDSEYTNDDQDAEIINFYNMIVNFEFNKINYLEKALNFIIRNLNHFYKNNNEYFYFFLCFCLTLYKKGIFILQEYIYRIWGVESLHNLTGKEEYFSLTNFLHWELPDEIFFWDTERFSRLNIIKLNSVKDNLWSITEYINDIYVNYATPDSITKSFINKNIDYYDDIVLVFNKKQFKILKSVIKFTNDIIPFPCFKNDITAKILFGGYGKVEIKNNKAYKIFYNNSNYYKEKFFSEILDYEGLIKYKSNNFLLVSNLYKQDFENFHLVLFLKESLKSLLWLNSRGLIHADVWINNFFYDNNYLLGDYTLMMTGDELLLDLYSMKIKITTKPARAPENSLNELYVNSAGYKNKSKTDVWALAVSTLVLMNIYQNTDEDFIHNIGIVKSSLKDLQNIKEVQLLLKMIKIDIDERFDIYQCLDFLEIPCDHILEPIIEPVEILSVNFKKMDISIKRYLSFIWKKWKPPVKIIEFEKREYYINKIIDICENPQFYNIVKNFNHPLPPYYILRAFDILEYSYHKKEKIGESNYNKYAPWCALYLSLSRFFVEIKELNYILEDPMNKIINFLDQPEYYNIFNSSIFYQCYIISCQSMFAPIFSLNNNKHFYYQNYPKFELVKQIMNRCLDTIYSEDSRKLHPSKIIIKILNHKGCDKSLNINKCYRKKIKNIFNVWL